jgi:hypothetical protein
VLGLLQMHLKLVWVSGAGQLQIAQLTADLFNLSCCNCLSLWRLLNLLSKLVAPTGPHCLNRAVIRREAEFNNQQQMQNAFVK